jgi:hypothetical protein
VLSPLLFCLSFIFGEPPCRDASTISEITLQIRIGGIKVQQVSKTIFDFTYWQRLKVVTFDMVVSCQSEGHAFERNPFILACRCYRLKKFP